MKLLKSYAAISEEHRKQLNYLEMIHPLSSLRLTFNFILLIHIYKRR